MERVKNDRGYNYVVRFPEKIRFEGEEKPKASVWFNVNHEGTPGEAKEAAWQYFKEVNVMFAQQHRDRSWSGVPGGFGPLKKDPSGEKWFHGSDEAHEFLVVRKPFGDAVHPGNKILIRNWDPWEHTAEEHYSFCGNARHVEYKDGADRYVCDGHHLLEARGEVAGPGEAVIQRPDDPAGDEGAVSGGFGSLRANCSSFIK